jgi:hypothetical protein
MCVCKICNLIINYYFFNIHTYIHTYIHMYACFAKICNLVNYYFLTNFYRHNTKTVSYFTTIITILGRTKRGSLVHSAPFGLVLSKKKKEKEKKGRPPPPMCLICGIWDSHVSMSGDSLFFSWLTNFGAQDVMHWWDGTCHADPAS